jgi:dTDP-4-dehydrorhamnose reductase
VILVVGVDGLIGGEIYRKLKATGLDVLGTSRRSESPHLYLDLGAPETFQMPQDVDVTVMCAGVGDIAACARSPKETSRINVAGTVQIANRAAEIGSRVVVLSTSLVFDGQTASPRAEDAVSPCCEYGRQKAVMESEISGEKCAIVRLTKVVETLRPRFSVWLRDMKEGRAVKASTELRFSPVSLDDAVRALCGLVTDFQPGIFHVTGDDSYSYHQAAVCLAEENGLLASLAVPDANSGLEFFQSAPVTASLAPAAPANCSGWRFSSSSAILSDFIRSL